MRATLEIPDQLFRQAQAAAAARGESFQVFVSEALRTRLDRRPDRGVQAPGFSAVFGKAPRGAVAEIDEILEAEFGQVDLTAWT